MKLVYIQTEGNGEVTPINPNKVATASWCRQHSSSSSSSSSSSCPSFAARSPFSQQCVRKQGSRSAAAEHPRPRPPTPQTRAGCAVLYAATTTTTTTAAAPHSTTTITNTTTTTTTTVDTTASARPRAPLYISLLTELHLRFIHVYAHLFVGACDQWKHRRSSRRMHRLASLVIKLIKICHVFYVARARLGACTRMELLISFRAIVSSKFFPAIAQIYERCVKQFFYLV
ncbi:unnamed protein product, partial [Trichogramma brassicae]